MGAVCKKVKGVLCISRRRPLIHLLVCFLPNIEHRRCRASNQSVPFFSSYHRVTSRSATRDLFCHLTFWEREREKESFFNSGEPEKPPFFAKCCRKASCRRCSSACWFSRRLLPISRNTVNRLVTSQAISSDFHLKFWKKKKWRKNWINLMSIQLSGLEKLSVFC